MLVAKIVLKPSSSFTKGVRVWFSYLKIAQYVSIDNFNSLKKPVICRRRLILLHRFLESSQKFWLRLNFRLQKAVVLKHSQNFFKTLKKLRSKNKVSCKSSFFRSLVLEDLELKKVFAILFYAYNFIVKDLEQLLRLFILKC